MPETLAARLERRLDARLDHVQLRQAATGVLRPSVGYDLAVWATVDPSTLMWTSCVLDGAPRDEGLETAVFRNEYLDRDVLKLTELADGDGAGTLATATGGDVLASPRGRDVLHPRGLDDELRLLFSDGATAWGALCLYRSGGRFADHELASLRDAARPFARLLRDAVLRDAAGRPSAGLVASGAPGLLVCRVDGSVVRASAEAAALLGTAPDALTASSPVAVRSVVSRHVAGLESAATAPGPAGQWLTLHATSLGDDVVVVVEPIRPHQVADVVVRSKGLTPRERDVLARVARGRSNRQVARELGLSEWTVQDHVKSLLAKFDVSSRGELVAALFFDGFGPLHSSG